MAKLKNQNSKAAVMLSILALLAVGLLVWTARSSHSTDIVSSTKTPKIATPTNSGSSVIQKETVAPDQVWPKQLSSEEASSLNVVVNKKHKLPSDYTPELVNIRGFKLRSEASIALEQLLTDAKNSGVSLKIISAYRSYSYQEQVYGGYVAQYGQEKADTISARPGHSEHQTGLAVDLGASDGTCDLEICFENTSAGAWIKDNAQNFGFIVRYLKGKETLTGYQYEPWHLRYVGVDIADKMNSSGQTMDEYFGVYAGSY